ncbi:MAG: CBS domain-containing protein [Rhodobacteraceae bacterium]|nr:MAG: CBS domain-containing protein [Paracoccaceae bacterium]
MTEYNVGTILRRDNPSFAPDTPIRRAVAVLVEARAAAAVVLTEDGALAGILSQKDCFRPALHAAYYQEWSGSVGDHMSREAVTVDVGLEVMAAAKMFMAHPHRVFPVVDGPRVAGVLYRSDVLALLSRIG